MRKRELPEWTARVGAEVRKRTDHPPTNEPYLVDVTELLRVICESEAKQQHPRWGIMTCEMKR
jgi:hypothetical protein